MAITNFNIFNEIFKIDYQPIMRDVLNSSTVLNKLLERDFESVQGDQVYFPINIQRNTSFASRSSAQQATLPARQQQGHTASFFTIPEMYGRLRINEKDIKASRNFKGAFLRIADYEMMHLIRDAKVHLNRMNFGDGSGIIAHVNGAPAADVLTVDVEHTGDASGTVSTYYATRFAEVGLNVEAVNSTKSAVVASTATTVVSTNSSTPSITVADDTTWDDDHYVAIEGSFGNDQMGLLGVVDDGADATFRFFTTFQGVDRSDAANNFWNAGILRTTPATLRNVTLDIIQEGADAAEVNGDGQVTLWLTTYGLRRNILNLLVADKRFSSPYELDLDGGFRALSYNGVPIIPDKDAPHHKLFGLDTPTLKFYSMSDLEWMEQDGAVLNRIPNEPAYEATLFLYREMGCTDPRNNVLIDNLNDPTVV